MRQPSIQQRRIALRPSVGVPGSRLMRFSHLVAGLEEAGGVSPGREFECKPKAHVSPTRGGGWPAPRACRWLPSLRLAAGRQRPSGGHPADSPRHSPPRPRPKPLCGDERCPGTRSTCGTRRHRAHGRSSLPTGSGPPSTAVPGGQTGAGRSPWPSVAAGSPPVADHRRHTVCTRPSCCCRCARPAASRPQWRSTQALCRNAEAQHRPCRQRHVVLSTLIGLYSSDVTGRIRAPTGGLTARPGRARLDGRPSRSRPLMSGGVAGLVNTHTDALAVWQEGRQPNVDRRRHRSAGAAWQAPVAVSAPTAPGHINPETGLDALGNAPVRIPGRIIHGCGQPARRCRAVADPVISTRSRCNPALAVNDASDVVAAWLSIDATSVHDGSLATTVRMPAPGGRDRLWPQRHAGLAGTWRLRATGSLAVVSPVDRLRHRLLALRAGGRRCLDASESGAGPLGSGGHPAAAGGGPGRDWLGAGRWAARTRTPPSWSVAARRDQRTPAGTQPRKRQCVRSSAPWAVRCLGPCLSRRARQVVTIGARQMNSVKPASPRFSNASGMHPLLCCRALGLAARGGRRWSVLAERAGSIYAWPVPEATDSLRGGRMERPVADCVDGKPTTR